MVHGRSGRGLTSEELALWHESRQLYQPLNKSGEEAQSVDSRGRRELTSEDRAAWEEASLFFDSSGLKNADGNGPAPEVPARGHAVGVGDAGLTRRPTPRHSGRARTGRSGPPSGMDPRLSRRIRQGKLKPERSLDLHGYSRQQAFVAVESFLHDARRSGLRLVLIVTGKGRIEGMDAGHTPSRRGVLRELVRNMLNDMRMSWIVLDYAAAHVRHGGAGAYYVYLRRLRTDRNRGDRTGRSQSGTCELRTPRR